MNKPSYFEEKLRYLVANFTQTMLLLKERIKEHNIQAWRDKVKFPNLITSTSCWPAFKLGQQAVFRMGPCQHIHKIHHRIPGNVRATMFEILRCFIANNKKLAKKAMYDFQTLNCSLAETTQNHIRTIQRHTRRLRMAGFLSAIQRTGRGLVMRLDASLLVLEEAVIKRQTAFAANIPPAPPAPLQPAPVAKPMERFLQLIAPGGAPPL